MDYRMFKNTYIREIDGKGLQVDKDMVNDCLANYTQFDDLKDAIVMDWGANIGGFGRMLMDCLLYTSDAADDLLCVDLGGRRII